jgi:hypothetical protein
MKLKMRYLETIADEGAMHYFPDSGLDSLISDIVMGSADALSAASNLVEVVFSELNFDNRKNSLVLSRALIK